MHSKQQAHVHGHPPLKRALRADIRDREIAVDLGETQPVRLIDLEPSQCRFPIRYEDGKHLFCGLPKFAATSYCLDHLRVALKAPLATSIAATNVQAPNSRPSSGGAMQGLDWMCVFRSKAGPQLKSLFESEGELPTALFELLQRLQKSEENRSPIPEKA